MSRTSRVFSLVAVTVVGMVIGVAGGFVQAHRSVVLIDGRYLVFPWGVLIVVVVLLIAIRAAAKLLHLRSAGWLVLGGWLAVTFLLATETPAGDIAVSSGVRQWGYLLSGAVVGSALATLPPASLSSMRNRRDESIGNGTSHAEGPSGLV